MNPSEFRLFVKLYRQQHTKAWRAKNQNPTFKMLYPYAIEETYAKEISAFQQKIVDLAISRLSVVIPKLYRKDDLREDADTDELEQILAELEQQLAIVYGTTYVSSGALGQILEHTAEKVFGFENLQYLKITKVMTGMPLSMNGASWWPAMKANWEATNYNLIKGLSKEFIGKLNVTLLNGYQSGWTQQEMAEAIQTLSDKITGYRANLIARDQVGKLTSFIARAQDESCGLLSYIWQAQRDEKLRGNPLGKYPKAIPSHYAIDFKICRWDNSTVYSEDGGKTWIPRLAIMPMVAPGIEILCFPGDTLVQSLTNAEILYRRRYEGRMVMLETADGLSIRCTPNHPIMRADGQMIPAYLLNEGDSVLHIITEQFPIGKADVDNRIATFEKIFNFSSVMFGTTLAYSSSSDFHGDGRSNEQVDIIPLYGELSEDIISKLDQSLVKNILSEADMCLSFVSSSADDSACLGALGCTSDSIVSLLSKLHTLFFTEGAHSDEVRLATAAKLYSIFTQTCGNGTPGNAVFFGQGENRGPVEVFSDYFFYRQLQLVCRLMNVQGTVESSLTKYLSNVGFADSRDFMDADNAISLHCQPIKIVKKFLTVNVSTHVYNLQVPSSRYTVSRERILVNNCRCQASPYAGLFLSDIDKEIEEAE